MRERRATVRVSCFLPAEYRLSDGTVTSSGQITNLSVQGLGLLTSQPLHPGHRLAARLALPNDGESLELAGLVRWSVDSPGRDGSSLAGVEFERLDETTRFCLQAFVTDQTHQGGRFRGRVSRTLAWVQRTIPLRALRLSGLLLGVLVMAALALWVLMLQRKNEQLVQALAERTLVVTQLEARQQQLQERLTQTGLQALDSASEVERLQRQTAHLEAQVGWLSQNLRDLKGAYERVRIERTQLADEVGHLERQQAELSHRLASVPDLQQAMREAVRVRRRDRRQAWLAQIAQQREQDRTAAQQGNRGYVVYEGTPTLTSGPRLSIRVLNPEPLSSPSETSP